MRTIISIIFVVIVVVVIIVIIVVVIVVIIILAILIRFVDVSPKIWQLVVFVRIMLFILHLLVLLGSNHRVYLEANFFDELNRLLLLSLYNLWLRLFNLSYSFLSLGLILLLSGSRLL